ncbi:MAG: hypothetical protein JSV80_01075 [Acidobacteriota bacterium]|nr:MAG: hypothetical protein JSV80_01075 [Acidobacteriota bacterium]
MAICPECGGRLFPVHLSALAPAAKIDCRWCRAKLSLARWARLALLGALVFASALVGGGFGLLLWYSGDPLHLVWLTAGLVAVALLTWLAGSAAPLRTEAPRGAGDWRPMREPEEPKSELRRAG